MTRCDSKIKTILFHKSYFQQYFNQTINFWSLKKERKIKKYISTEETVDKKKSKLIFNTATISDKTISGN